MDEHISENELSMFAFSPDAVLAERRWEITRHVGVCAECRALHDCLIETEEDLRDIDVRERHVGSETYDSAMAHAARIAQEDREAEELVKPYIDNPALAAYKNLATQRNLLTAGVVRRFTARSHDICENQPLDGLTLAEAATVIADTLPENAYAGKTVFELRGAAHLQQATSLMLLGQLPAALEECTRAERAYKNLRSSGFGLACTALVRAGALYSQQRFEEATASAERAEHGFAHIGDDDRRMKAILLRGNIRIEAFDLENAVTTFQHLIAYGESIDSARWVAVGWSRLGDCEVLRGNLGEASMHYHNALSHFRQHGPANERVSAEWGIARVQLHGGRRTEAIRRLRDVVAEFEVLGILTDAAVASLDIADGLLALGEVQQIVGLASRLFRVFSDAEMLTGALTAIAYMKEAAAAGTLTPRDLRVVRQFLRRAELQPELLFVPPPAEGR